MSPQPLASELVELLPRLRRFALSLTGSASEADDLVQSACERALRAHESFIPGTRLDSWVFRIIRNLWIDTVRRRKSEGAVSTDDDIELSVAAEDGRRVTEASLTVQDVAKAVDRLPEEQRAVLLLVCAEERSYQDTARELGIPIGTVMSRLARARRGLAAALNLDDAVAEAKPEGRTLP